MFSDQMKVTDSLSEDFSKLSLNENVSVLDIFCRTKNLQLDSFIKKENALLTFKGVLQICNTAIDAFERSEISKFDALVSDCACQNRTAFIAEQAMRFLKDIAFQESCISSKRFISEKLIDIEEKLRSVSAKKNQKGKKSKKPDRETFIKRFDVSIPKELVFLSQCFMLTKAKCIIRTTKKCFGCEEMRVFSFREETAPEQVEEMNGLSPSSIKVLLQDAKKSLSLFCCQFLQKKAKTLDPLWQIMLSERNLKLLQGRYELPCFYTVKTALESTLALKVSLLVKVKRSQHLVENFEDPFDVAILFRKNERGKLVPFFPTTEDEILPCFVVEGMRCGKSIQGETPIEYTKRLLNFDIQKIFELNTAQHSQYSDRKIQTDEIFSVVEESSIQEEREKLKKLKVESLDLGCSLQNQSLFCITHIFCDTLQNQMKNIQLIQPEIES